MQGPGVYCLSFGFMHQRQITPVGVTRGSGDTRQASCLAVNLLHRARFDDVVSFYGRRIAAVCVTGADVFLPVVYVLRIRAALRKVRIDPILQITFIPDAASVLIRILLLFHPVIRLLAACRR